MSPRASKREILVYADWNGLGAPRLMGKLRSELSRGSEIFSFDYDAGWLQSGSAQILDPDLELYEGRQYLSDAKPNFGIFLDSSPDRWGRILMRRREAAIARRDGRKEEKLFETDYLLGVFDGHRMGAIRFKLEPEGPFLNDNVEMAAPPWTSIPALEEISIKLEQDDAPHDPDYLKWLNILVAPGSSLGGARPKANVLDRQGHPWIAKFPSKNDETNIGAWEMVTYEMAVSSGIRMAECKALKFSGRHHTFLTKRFDRTPTGRRIHFASAMTLLGYSDGQEEASYLDLLDFITTYGGNVNADLEELWRRMVFHICVSNTDDHLRNHGFMLTSSGWQLSPAYDINPVETGKGLNLNITENDNALDLGLAMEVHEYFRISRSKAEEIIGKITSAVRNWKKHAKRYGISTAEQEIKALAFSRAHI